MPQIQAPPELNQKRKDYRYDHTALPGFVVAMYVPPEQRPPEEFHKELDHRDKQAVLNMARVIEHAVVKRDPFNEVQDYEDFFQLLPRPDHVVSNWRSDSEFAWQRIAGANPMAIQRVTSTKQLKSRISLTDQHIADVCGNSGVGLEWAIQERRLYWVD